MKETDAGSLVFSAVRSHSDGLERALGELEDHLGPQHAANVQAFRKALVSFSEALDGLFALGGIGRREPWNEGD